MHAKKKNDSNMQIGMHSDKEQGEMLREECPVWSLMERNACGVA